MPFVDEFGSFKWSPDNTKLLYIAEKKPPKTEPFYKQKPQNKKDDETTIAVSALIIQILTFFFISINVSF